MSQSSPSPGTWRTCLSPSQPEVGAFVRRDLNCKNAGAVTSGILQQQLLQETRQTRRPSRCVVRASTALTNPSDQEPTRQPQRTRCTLQIHVNCHKPRAVSAFVVRASLAGAETSGEDDGAPPKGLIEKVVAFQYAFWKFLRPHTIRGTVLGTTAVVAKALLESSHAINWALMPRALRGLLALLCGNGYIVGINQIYDTEIDKVNKPFLPVASGELTPSQAAFLCAALGLGGVAIVATNFGRLITGLYSLGLLLGTLYSVPPLRLKRFPLPAFLIIATVRGLLLNFGVYYATRAALGLPFAWSPSILFITVFVTVFATVIAVTKDLPDVEGDRRFKVETFATKLGVRTIAFAGSGLLLLNYIGAVVAALRMPTAFRAPLMVSAHAILGLSLVFQTWKLDAAKSSQEAIAGFYRFIWNLFYLEYALLPFI